MSPTDLAGIETSLRSIGRDIAYPETPELTGPVMQRIARAPRTAPAPSRWSFRFALAAAAAIAIATFAAMALSPSARRAVADWLGVDGVRITFDDPVPAESLGEELFFGEPVSVEEAQALVDFDIAVPAELGSPDAVYVEGNEVSLVWESRVGLPQSTHTGVGAVLTQFVGSPEPLSIKKMAGGSEVRYFTIDGGEAFFIFGAPHVVIREPDGGTRELPPRLAGNTLLWDGGEVTYRLEAQVDQDRAVEIMESLR